MEETFKQIKRRPHKIHQQQQTDQWQQQRQAASTTDTKKKSQKNGQKSAADKKLVDTKLYTHCACISISLCSASRALSLTHTQLTVHFVSAQFKFQ